MAQDLALLLVQLYRKRRTRFARRAEPVSQPESPTSSRHLSDSEKLLAVTRLAEVLRSIGHPSRHLYIVLRVQ